MSIDKVEFFIYLKPYRYQVMVLTHNKLLWGSAARNDLHLSTIQP